MKIRNRKWIMALALPALIALDVQLSEAFAQGTGFTYQGQLQNSGSPASGYYNLTFTLFNTNTGGVAIAGPVTNNSVIVSNSLFTTLVDFGAGVFTGSSNWLEIAVEANGGSSFNTLAPRQQLTPVPYAISAESANNLLGILPVAQLPADVVTNNQQGVNLCGTFCGNGLNLQTLTSVGYLYYYSLALQGSGAVNTFGNALFGNPGPSDFGATGWSYNVATGIFTCNQTGTYLIEYDAEVSPAAPGAGSMTIRALFDAPPNPPAFIPGSQVSLDTGAFAVGTYIPVSKSFIAPYIAGQTLAIQFASTIAGGVTLQNPAGVIGPNQPSISLTIVRIQ